MREYKEVRVAVLEKASYVQNLLTGVMYMKRKVTGKLLAAFFAACCTIALPAACKTETDSSDPGDTTAPAVVTKFTATPGDGSVVLTWMNPDDSDLYGIQLSAKPAAGNLASPVLVGKGCTSYMVSGLTDGTEYTFSASSLDMKLNASKDVTATATPVDSGDHTAPAEVSNFKAQAGDGSVVLTWTNPTDSDLYGIQLSANPAAGTLASPVLLGKECTTYTVSGLTDGTKYTFSASTLDTSLNTDKTVTATATPVDSGDHTAPGDITDLTAVNKDASVLLSWTDASDSDVYGYEVSWDRTTPINRSIVAMPADTMMVAPGNGGCYISNLTNGTSYTFTVKSVDTGGNKSSGATVSCTPSYVEQPELSVSLTESTTDVTSQDVTVSVGVTTEKAGIKSVAYISGTAGSAAGVFADTNSKILTADADGAYSFTASANGTYTAAALDTAGREECAYITISNIDKTAPASAANPAASYSSAQKAITVTWTDPGDSDLDHLSLSWTNGTAEGSVPSIAKGTQSYTLESISADSAVYTITLTAYDAAGNAGSGAAVTVTASAAAEITAVSLNKTHFDSSMSESDRAIDVTLTGSNLNLITDTTGGLRVQVTDGATAQTPVTATVSSAGSAHATVTAPVPGAATDAGTTYTVKVILNNTALSSPTAAFIVSKPASVTSITLGKTQVAEKTGGTVSVTVEGKNFDIRGTTYVRLYDSTSTEVTGSAVSVPSGTGSATEFTCSLPVPDVSGVYAVKVLFGGTAQTTTTQLQVYGAPEFTSVSIPKAGESYEGGTVPMLVYGKNFTAPGITADSFSIAGTTASGVTIASDTLFVAQLTVPYTTGDTAVTVSCGSKSTQGTLTVLASGDCYTSDAIGKIICTDGSLVAAGDYTSSGKTAVAVIFDVRYGGSMVLGVGLTQNSSSVKWAPEGTTGCNTDFSAIKCIVSGGTKDSSDHYSGYTFSGDTDGSDNWLIVKAIDPDGSADAANYPAFNYAATYGTAAGIEGIYENDWYLPSAAELHTLYTHQAVVNTALTAVGKENVNKDYISSSQSEYKEGVYHVQLYNGGIGSTYKQWGDCVRAVRLFSR